MNARAVPAVTNLRGEKHVFPEGPFWGRPAADGPRWFRIRPDSMHRWSPPARRRRPHEL